MEVANSVEHRWSQRHKAMLAVDVYREGVKLFSCCSRDVGLGGVFLETDQCQHAPQAGAVELIFKLGGEAPHSRYRLHAHVVRTTDNGLGLTFKDFDTGAFRALQEIIRHIPNSSRSVEFKGVQH